MQTITRKEQRAVDTFNKLISEGRPVAEALWEASEQGKAIDTARLQDIAGHKAAEPVVVETIDMTPTWGEVGTLFYRLAVSKEVNAIRAGRAEFAKAFALAEAMSKLKKTLTEEQSKLLAETLTAELTKQGF